MVNNFMCPWHPWLYAIGCRKCAVIDATQTLALAEVQAPRVYPTNYLDYGQRTPLATPEWVAQQRREFERRAARSGYDVKWL